MIQAGLVLMVVVFNGIAYWAYSYIDKWVAKNIVGYDAAGMILR
jgi:hypothetical protein